MAARYLCKEQTKPTSTLVCICGATQGPYNLASVDKVRSTLVLCLLYPREWETAAQALSPPDQEFTVSWEEALTVLTPGVCSPGSSGMCTVLYVWPEARGTG